MAAWDKSGPMRLLPRLFTLALVILLLLQLLFSSIVPRSSSSPGDQPVFTVISIQGIGRVNESQQSEARGGAELRSEDTFEDENEVQVTDREFVLQPWASGRPFFTAEVQRLNQFISTPEVNCSRWQDTGEAWSPHVVEGSEALCMNHWTSITACVAYSFSLDEKDAAFLESTQSMGCEVHRFDPSIRGRYASSSGFGSIQHHQTWLDWRRPRSHPHKRFMSNMPCRLVDIMDSLGHRMVDVLWANLESAEWRLLESWIQDGTLQRIDQLILTIHLQWAGFEVSGTEMEVVRFWYSVLRALHSSGFQLTHSAHGSGHTVLGHELPNMHSSYTLIWVKTIEQL